MYLWYCEDHICRIFHFLHAYDSETERKKIYFNGLEAHLHSNHSIVQKEMFWHHSPVDLVV